MKTAMSRYIYNGSSSVFSNDVAIENLDELSGLANVEIRYAEQGPKALAPILPDILAELKLVKSWYDTLGRSAEEDADLLKGMFTADGGRKRWKKFYQATRLQFRQLQSRREQSGWHAFHCPRGQQHNKAVCEPWKIIKRNFKEMPLFKEFVADHRASTGGQTSQRISLSPRAGILLPVERVPSRRQVDSNRDSGLDINDPSSPSRTPEITYNSDFQTALSSAATFRKGKRSKASKAFWSEDTEDSEHLCGLPSTNPVPWKWFHALPAYTNWKARRVGGDLNILPIVASSGVGKSVLSNSIIHDLHRSGGSTIVSFAFRHDLEDRKSARSMLMACISQLMDMNLGAIPPLAEKSTKGNVGRPLAWSLEKLWERFTFLLRECSSKNNNIVQVYWILDALNDCDEDSRSKLLKLLLQLAVPEFDNVHVLITSTPDRTLEMGLEELRIAALSLDLYRSKEIRHEINAYIGDKIDYLGARHKYEDTVTGHIKQELCKRHHDHFIWAAILVQEFEKCGLSEASVEQILDGMPESLAQHYGKHLTHAELTAQREPDIREVLSVLIAAQRPLTVSDVKFVLALQEPRADMHDVGKNLLYTLNIEDLCGGLVRISHKDGEDWLHLVHSSVKDFLLSEAAEKFGFRLDEGEAHYMLAMACLHFLMLPEAKDFCWDCNCFCKGESCTRNPKHPGFYSYSAIYWSFHVAEINIAEPRITDIKAMIDLLPLWIYVVDRHRTDPDCGMSYPNSYRRHPENTSMIHTAGHFNILWLVKHLVDEDATLVDKKVDRGGTPIVFAAERGNIEVVEVLLKAGADVNAQEDDHWTALHWAKTNGHDKLAEILIKEWHARQDIRDDCRGWTPDQWASECWRRQIMTKDGRYRELPQISEDDMRRNGGRYETAEAAPS